MDPHAALTEIRQLVEAHERDGYLTEDSQDRLCELVAALDEWLSAGGFSPWAPRLTGAHRPAPAHVIRGTDCDSYAL